MFKPKTGEHHNQAQLARAKQENFDRTGLPLPYDPEYYAKTVSGSNVQTGSNNPNTDAHTLALILSLAKKSPRRFSAIARMLTKIVEQIISVGSGNFTSLESEADLFSFIVEKDLHQNQLLYMAPSVWKKFSNKNEDALAAFDTRRVSEGPSVGQVVQVNLQKVLKMTSSSPERFSPQMRAQHAVLLVTKDDLNDGKALNDFIALYPHSSAAFVAVGEADTLMQQASEISLGVKHFRLNQKSLLDTCFTTSTGIKVSQLTPSFYRDLTQKHAIPA